MGYQSIVKNKNGFMMRNFGVRTCEAEGDQQKINNYLTSRALSSHQHRLFLKIFFGLSTMRFPLGESI